MTGPEFDNLMQIVYSRWGAKAYPDVVKNRIWYFVRDLPQKSFEKMIYTLLDVSRAAPMPHEFKMLSYAEADRLGLRRGNSEPQSKPSAEAECWDCADSGNLFTEHKKFRTTATFRCHCAVGAKRPTAQGVQWTEYYAGTYEKQPIYPGHSSDGYKPTGSESALDILGRLLGKPNDRKRKGSLTSAREVIAHIGLASRQGPEGEGA